MDTEQKPQDIALPIEVIDGRFTLEEIGTIAVLMGIPILPAESIEKWGKEVNFTKVINDFVKAGVAIVVPEGDGVRLEFDLT